MGGLGKAYLVNFCLNKALFLGYATTGRAER